MINTIKKDLVLGVKAEQSLRDEVRNNNAESTGNDDLDLVPFGRKDWIAGVRMDAELKYSEISLKSREVMNRLLTLGSQQRIRIENIRLYVVAEQVPVFKDPPKDDMQEETLSSDKQPLFTKENNDNSSRCPICNRVVHQYNLQYNPNGAVTGCFMCGGTPPVHPRN